MYPILWPLFITIAFFSCKSSIKQQTDTVYSRHLQRHVPLTIISTTMPDKKEKMNLLLFNNPELLEDIRAKKTIDSLFKNKLIQPLTLVAFEGKKGDYGLEEANIAAAKQYKKFNEFVIGELYPFVKKKAVIRKFNSVAIVGFGESAISAFDISWNNDDKIQKAGLFFPLINFKDETMYETINSFRKRPNASYWILNNNKDSSIIKLHEILSTKNNNTTSIMVNSSSPTNDTYQQDFAAFLLWAFPK